MEVKQLRYFVAIAEEHSLSAAAKRLGIAQPSLSQQMSNLEQKVGVKLLLRSPRGVTLTEQGDMLLARGRDVIALMDRTLEEVRRAGGDSRGAVAFALPSSVSTILSVPLAETIRKSLPEVQLRVVEAMSGLIRGWLEEGSVDLAILYDVSHLHHMRPRLLITERFELFSAPGAWPLATAPGIAVSLADAAALDLVLPSHAHGVRSLTDQVTRAHGIALNVAVEMDSLAQLKSYVARGNGFTILAPSAAQDMVDRGQLVSAPIRDPAIQRAVYLVRNPDKPATGAGDAVERETLKIVNDLISRNVWRGNRLPAP